MFSPYGHLNSFLCFSYCFTKTLFYKCILCVCKVVTNLKIFHLFHHLQIERDTIYINQSRNHPIYNILILDWFLLCFVSRPPPHYTAMFCFGLHWGGGGLCLSSLIFREWLLSPLYSLPCSYENVWNVIVDFLYCGGSALIKKFVKTHCAT